MRNEANDLASVWTAFSGCNRCVRPPLCERARRHQDSRVVRVCLGSESNDKTAARRNPVIYMALNYLGDDANCNY